MPAITYYWKNAVPTGATAHRSLQDGGTPPTTATTTTGWVANSKASGQMCLMQGGTEVSRTDSSWGSGIILGIPASTGDCWRSENTYNGTFASGTWAFTIGVRSVTAAYAGRFRLNIRVWRSTDPDGSGATPLAATSTTNTTTASLSTSADTTLTLNLSPGSTFVLTNEFLFVQMAFEVVGTAGSGNTQDMDFRVGSAYTLVTPTFTVFVPTSVPNALAMMGCGV